MALSAVHDKLEDIPEAYRDLYTEKDNKFELTGIAGIKTDLDVQRVQTSLTKERTDHKVTKASLGNWAKLGDDLETVQGSLDRIPELEAASAGKLDEAAIEVIVKNRVEGTIQSRLAPLERDLATAKESVVTLTGTNETLSGEKTQRSIHDAMRTVLAKEKIPQEFHEDVFMHADRLFTIREDDNAIITRDNVGATPGVGPEIWLQDMRTKRPGWWPASEGGGGDGGGGGGGGGGNPWNAATWNMTAQGQYIKTNGMVKAEAMAKQAGTSVGGKKPPAKS